MDHDLSIESQRLKVCTPRSRHSHSVSLGDLLLESVEVLVSPGAFGFRDGCGVDTCECALREVVHPVAHSDWVDVPGVFGVHEGDDVDEEEGEEVVEWVGYFEGS